MKKQKLQEDQGQKTEQSKLSVTDHVFVFSDLPLVYPILNNTTSYTVQHLTQLGVANIAVHIAESLASLLVGLPFSRKIGKKYAQTGGS